MGPASRLSLLPLGYLQYNRPYLPELYDESGLIHLQNYHGNAEFQRIARRDKKAFLNDQCKEIEENNRMGKTRDLFNKIRDTKGTFHEKMVTIKNRNGMDLKILRRGGKNTQKNYTKNIFTTQIIKMVWSLI